MRFGDDAYCLKEACAEIVAGFLCARLGIAAEPHPDHARYIHHWLSLWRAAHNLSNRVVPVM